MSGVWIATEAREAGPSRTRSQQSQKARRKWTEEKGSRVDKNMALPRWSTEEEGEEGWMEGQEAGGRGHRSVRVPARRRRKIGLGQGGRMEELMEGGHRLFFNNGEITVC